MYSIKTTNRFKKDFKLCEKRNYDFSFFDEVFDELMELGKLTQKNKPHILSANYSNHWECHIKPDWLLIWLQDEDEKTITLVRTGTHSDLFKK